MLLFTRREGVRGTRNEVVVGLLLTAAAPSLLLMNHWLANRLPTYSIEEEQEEGRRLDAARKGMRERIAATEAIVTAIAADRIPLEAAVQEYLIAHQDAPSGFEEQHLKVHGGATFLESVARDLAARAYAHTSDPVQRVQVVVRLKDEFEAMFPKAGPLAFDPLPLSGKGRA